MGDRWAWPAEVGEDFHECTWTCGDILRMVGGNRSEAWRIGRVVVDQMGRFGRDREARDGGR